MKVTSENKAAAARANGALSRGPVTPEGKARSSQNAMQHGLFAATVVLATENQEAFNAMLQDYFDYYQPVGRVEQDMIYQLTACVWRMGRAFVMESQVMDKAAGAITGPRSAAERVTDGYFNISDSAGAKSLDRMQSRLDRTQSRLIHDFLFLRRRHNSAEAARAAEPNEAPAPTVSPDPEPPQNLRNEPITPSVSNETVPTHPPTPLPPDSCLLTPDSSLSPHNRITLDTADVRARLEKFEGRVPWMYRCTGGEVTVGIGHAIHSAADARKLTWDTGAGQVAAAFAIIAGAPKGQVARNYAPLTTCRMSNHAIDALTAADIDAFTAQLRTNLPKFDTYPAPAQAALFDMAFNLGIGELKKFTHMLAAVDAGDWETAARQSHRNGIQDARSDETAALFRQCLG